MSGGDVTQVHLSFGCSHKVVKEKGRGSECCGLCSSPLQALPACGYVSQELLEGWVAGSVS